MSWVEDNKEYREDIEKLIEADYTISQLAEACGVSLCTMYLDLRKFGIKPPASKNSPVVDESRLERLQKLLDDPKTVIELMESLDISKPTLYRDFKRLEEREIFVSRVGYSRPARYRIG